MNKQGDETMDNQQQEFEVKEIKGYEKMYSVTSDGKVFGHKRNKYLNQKTTRFGYAEVILSNGKDAKRNVKYITVHRLVANAFIPNPNNLPQINHIDSNKLNNDVSNLEWMSAKDNIRHSWANGMSEPSRPNLGKNMPNAKSKYRNVIYIGKNNSFKAVLCRVKDGNRFTKTKSFSIDKYGYNEAERLAAEAVNMFIDTYPEFSDAEKLQIRVQRPSEESEYTPSGVETANALYESRG